MPKGNLYAPKDSLIDSKVVTFMLVFNMFVCIFTLNNVLLLL